MEEDASSLILGIEGHGAFVVPRGSDFRRSVAVGLGALLISASLLKLWSQTRHPPVPNPSWLDEPAAVGSVAVLEAVLATVSIAGPWRRAAWHATIVVFGLFAIVAAVEAIWGRASCGCFGAVQVRPIYTMVLDLAAVTMLVVTGRPDGEGQNPEGKRQKQPASMRRSVIACGVGTVWLAAALGFWLTRPRVVVASASAKTSGQDFGKAGELVVLEPEKWAGQRFNLAEHIDVGSQLSNGRWIVLLVHHDCDHCAAAVPKYVAEYGGAVSSSNSDGRSPPRLAVIEMPPFGDANDPPPWQLPSTVLAGRLDESRDWFATTPVAIYVQAGLIVSAKEGGEAGDSLFTSAPFFAAELSQCRCAGDRRTAAQHHG
jgi:hypothetical protein